MQTAPTTSPKTDLSDVNVEAAPGGARKEEARQRVFDTAARTIYAQGGPAYFDGCKYRTANGRKCNLGAAIPDELYTTSLEGLSASQMPQSLMDAIGIDHVFADRLQDAHDMAAIRSSDGIGFWDGYARRMATVAREYDLSTTVLDTLQAAQE